MANREKKDSHEPFSLTQDEPAPLAEISDEEEQKLVVGSRTEWESPWGITYTFVMPSGDAYRRLVRDRQITVLEHGISLNPAIVEPLMADYIAPRPDPKRLTPGQWDRLCIEFFGFLQRTS